MLEKQPAIVDHAPHVQYHLESQGKANYWRSPPESTVAHEIAHRQRGDVVAVAGHLAQRGLRPLVGVDADFWNPPPGNPGGPANLFDGTIYTRGAMTLQALRQKLGDERFFGILRAWYAENRYGNVTTADFIALSERIGGQELDAFFDIWLYRPGKPEPGSW